MVLLGHCDGYSVFLAIRIRNQDKFATNGNPVILWRMQIDEGMKDALGYIVLREYHSRPASARGCGADGRMRTAQKTKYELR